MATTTTYTTRTFQSVNILPTATCEVEDPTGLHIAAQSLEVSYKARNPEVGRSREQHQQQTATLPSDSPQHDNPSTTSSPPRPEAHESNPKAKSMFGFLLDTRIGNAIGILGLPTLGLALFSGITAYRDMKWSEHANAVQTCASLYSIGSFSEFCNATIREGIETAPLAPRWIMGPQAEGKNLNRDRLPMILTSVVFCTTAALIFGTVLIRPQMQPFAPIISRARLDSLKLIPGLECVRFQRGSKIKAVTIRRPELAITAQDEDFSTDAWLIQDFAQEDLISETSNQNQGNSCFATASQICDTLSIASLSSTSEILPKVRKLHARAKSQSERPENHFIVEAGPSEPSFLNSTPNDQPAYGQSPEMRYYVLMQEDVQHYTSRIAKLKYVNAQEPHSGRFSKADQARYEQRLEALQARLTSAQQALRLAESCLDPEWGRSDYPQDSLVDSIKGRGFKTEDSVVFDAPLKMGFKSLIPSYQDLDQRAKRPTDTGDNIPEWDHDSRSHWVRPTPQHRVKGWLAAMSSDGAAQDLAEATQIEDCDELE